MKRIGQCSSMLSPRKKLLYNEYKLQKTTICKLKTKLFQSRNSLKLLSKASNTSAFTNLEKNFNAITANLIKSQFRNLKRQRPSWSQEDKIFALAVHKRGPKCYRFLRKYINLPSVSSLNRILKDIPLSTGVNLQILYSLKRRLAKCSEELQKCVLLFDEVSLQHGLTYDQLNDNIVGYVDMGDLGRFREEANHALVFMLASVSGKWKQPIAFYFSKDQTKTIYLKGLLRNILSCLIKNGFDVIGCICDQGKVDF